MFASRASRRAHAIVHHIRSLSSASTSTSTSTPAAASRFEPPPLAAAAVGVLGIGLAAYTVFSTSPDAVKLFQTLSQTSSAVADPSLDECAKDSAETRARRLSRWLETNGGVLHHIALRPSASGVSAYYDAQVKHAYASALPRRRGKEEEVMRVPASAAVNAATCARHPELGSTYEALMREGKIDERLAVMLFLMIERRRGEQSAWKEYIDCLPRTFDVPLYFDDDELERELKGTTLYGAAKAQRVAVKKVFEESVKGAFAELVKAENKAGGNVREPASIEEFKWAYAAFWSRALAIPVERGAHVLESIVPGIDMINHVVDAKYANARWEYVEDPSRADGGFIALVTPKNRALENGEELFIHYGDKSNEELLFAYGFAVDGNENDVLVLQPPWANEPVDERSMDVRARVAALAARGLPQHVTLQRVPPRRGFRDFDKVTQETLQIWVDDDVSLPKKPTAETAFRAHARLRAALGAQSSALRALERERPFDTPDSTVHQTSPSRARACRAYRRSSRASLDAYVDAASRWFAR